MKRYRVYCIGYEPGGRQLHKHEIDQLMSGADVCALAPSGIPIGTIVRDIVVHYEGDGGGPPAGPVALRCVAHEHKGKIAILEDQSS